MDMSKIVWEFVTGQDLLPNCPYKPISLKKVEERMKPERWSIGGFIGKHESLQEILEEDDVRIREIGITHDAIANRIEYFIKRASEIAEELGDMDGAGIVDNGKYYVESIVYGGGQQCPWGTAKSYYRWGNRNYLVVNTELKEKIIFPGLILHLIRNHHFYEGKQSPYRVDPVKAVRVLEINKV